MKIYLPLDDDPDKKILEMNLKIMFEPRTKSYVLGYETEKGTFISIKSKNSEKLIRNSFIKPYFENILCNKGEDGVYDEISNLINEIERGD